MSTVRATREASVKELVAQSLPRLDRMLAHGTTTAEIKTGYGLDYSPEMRMLDAIKILDRRHPIDLVPTFMGAHAIPEEYEGKSDEYVQLVVEGMLPRAAKEGAHFCDVFCEEGAFTLEQSRRILERAKELGLGLKIHADEFKNLGGATLAAQLGAISAEHLVHTREEEMELLAQARTIAVLLPGTPFGLNQPHYAPARRLIELGVPVALATDLNPGTCYCESMAFIMALACRKMQMTPSEAVVASTINAAYAIGEGKEIGSLKEGKKADLIVLDTHDYRDLAYRFGTNLVTMVFKVGQRVWPL